jgi:hypothetical protein
MYAGWAKVGTAATPARVARIARVGSKREERRVVMAGTLRIA